MKQDLLYEAWVMLAYNNPRPNLTSSERGKLLEACLRDTVRELLSVMEEDYSDESVDEYISTWFSYVDEESRQYDHIGR